MARKKKKSKGKKLDPVRAKHRAKKAELAAPPPRTSSYNKKTGVQTSGAIKIGETPTESHYQWTEDSGGKDVKVKRRTYKKDHATPMMEKDWVSINGSTCKINRDKFDPNYEEIFGKKEQGAATGKFKKTKKVYK